MSQTFDAIVLGAGMAGLTASQRLAAAGLSIANIESQVFGGLVLNVNELNPRPPGESTSGADLASTLQMQVADAGVEMISDTVTALARDADGFRVEAEGGVYRAGAVLVATGARLRHLGVPGEQALENRGVAHCADCDGPFYTDMDVVVVGGGDSAIQAALALATYCRRVHVLHRGTALRAQPQLVELARSRSNIEVQFGVVVQAVLGSDAVEGVRIQCRGEDGPRTLECAGFFAFVGLAPNSEFLPADVQRDAAGRVVTDGQFHTAMRGVFAAGAVRAGCGGLLTDAIADGEAAADALQQFARS